MRKIFLILLLSVSGYSQSDLDILELKAIAETLPSYLDRHPSSAASYLRGNYGYNTFRNYMVGILESGIISDSFERKEGKKQIERLEVIADSLANVLASKKIQVKIKDSLFTYNYIAKEFFDLRKEEDWKIQREYLEEDFTKNTMVRLDTTISAEYADLIKLQIDLSYDKKDINLTKLNNENYEFINIADDCRDNDLCIVGYKIYRPVFNEEKNKGCYLFSTECNGICRDFIFIEKKEGKWTFVESYPSHLIGYEK